MVVKKENTEPVQEEVAEASAMEQPTLEEVKAEKCTENKTPSDITKDLGSFHEAKQLSDLRGIGPKTVEKLNDCGYKNILDLATGRADEVAAMMKVTYRIAKAWVEEASEAVLLKMETINAEEYDKEKKSKVIIFSF